MTLPHEATLRAGTATADITPDGPVEMSGYGAREGPSTGVHDPLSASALILDDGAVTVGLVSVDVLNVSRELTRRVRRSLAADGIDLDELFLAATHTHAGPYLPARAIDVSPPLGAGTDVSATVEFVEQRLVEVLTEAYGRREPASIRIGRARETEASVNRRTEGGVGGDVRLSFEGIDPEVTALLVETATGERTVVYNFACHPVCTTAEETLLSADWPAYARRRIRDEYGDVPILFLNGAAGDINPTGMDPTRSDDAVYEYMERIGTRIGDAALRALADAESDSGSRSRSRPGSAIRRAPIRLERAELRLALKPTPSASAIRDRIADLEDRIDRLDDADGAFRRDTLAADKQHAEELLAIAKWDAKCLPTHLPYIELGDLGILGMPGEVFVRHGLDFKERASVSTLVPTGYVNGYVGYVPTLSELERGGYEIRTAKIAPEAVVDFRAAAIDLVT